MTNGFSRRLHGVLIGSANYPNVNTGFLAASGRSRFDKNSFLKNNLGFDSIVRMRRQLLKASKKIEVKSNPSYLEDVKLTGMAVRPFDVDLSFKPSVYNTSSNYKELLPHGPSVKLEKLELTSNPKIPRKIYRYADDYDVKADISVKELYGKGYSEEYLSSLLSTSNLGLKTERKLVPTRWSITAVDDKLSIDLKNKLPDESVDGGMVFYHSYLGNSFYVLLFPGPWEYELIEITSEGIMRDYENVFGRKTYADDTTGGYYACRLAVAEYLFKIGKQAKILVVREIKDDYKFSLGVWVVREAVRNAMENNIAIFDDVEELLNKAKFFINKDFLYTFGNYVKRSNVVNSVKNQKLLTNYK